MTAVRTSLLVLLAATLVGCASAAPGVPEPPSAPPPAPPAAEEAGEAGPVQMARAWTHGAMNLRAGPGTGHPVVSEVPAGTELWIGRPDRTGWARVYDPRQFSMEAVASRGWIYARSRLLRPKPPAGRRRS